MPQHESSQGKVLALSGEVPMPTSAVTSQLEASTSPARTSTGKFSARTTQRSNQVCSAAVAWPPVELQALPPSPSFTPSISREPDSALMSGPEPIESSPDSLTASRRTSRRMVLRDSTEVPVSLSFGTIAYRASYFGAFDTGK